MTKTNKDGYLWERHNNQDARERNAKNRDLGSTRNVKLLFSLNMTDRTSCKNYVHLIIIFEQDS